MREIKFRMLEKDHSRWEYFVIDQIRDLSERELENSIEIGSPIWRQAVKEGYFDFSTFTQFTGLHDNGGKGVYEGDFIEYMNGDERVRRCVEWNNNNARFLFVAQNPFDMEVIGNIYEHPELLPDGSTAPSEVN